MGFIDLFKSRKENTQVVFSALDAALEENSKLQIMLHQKQAETEELLERCQLQEKQLQILKSRQAKVDETLRETANAKARAIQEKRFAEKEALRANQIRRKIEKKIEKMIMLKAQVEQNLNNVEKAKNKYNLKTTDLAKNKKYAANLMLEMDQIKDFYKGLRPLKDESLSYFQPINLIKNRQTGLKIVNDHPLAPLTQKLDAYYQQHGDALTDSIVRQEVRWMRQYINVLEILFNDQQTSFYANEMRSEKSGINESITDLLVEKETFLLTAYENFEVYCQQHQPCHLVERYPALLILINDILNTFSDIPDNPLIDVFEHIISNNEAAYFYKDHILSTRNVDEVQDIQWLKKMAVPVLLQILELIRRDTLQATGFNKEQANFLYLGNKSIVHQLNKEIEDDD